jgi:hypothetical protein
VRARDWSFAKKAVAVFAVCAVMGSGTVLGETIGNNGITGGSFFTNNSRYAIMTEPIPTNGEITSISIYHNYYTGANKYMILGIYENDSISAAFKPGERLAITPTTLVNSAGPAWQTVPLTSPIKITSGTKVWLAVTFSVNPGIYRISGTPGYCTQSTAWTWGVDNMPSVFGTSGSIQSYKISINANYIPDYIWDNDGNSLIYTMNANNKIGIGTNAIGSLLQVANNAAIGYSTSTSAPANGLAVSGTSYFESGPLSIGTTNVPGTNGKLQVNGGAVIGYSAAGTNPPTNGLIVSGKVGIGTTTTGTFKLAVEGKIGAREVVVTQTSPWPDFVFKKDFKLKPLDEVEKHIRTHKRLESMPTETEVMDNGIPVGEMQAKLLQKIEELTLYMIDQNKKIEKLARANDELRRELSVKR